MTIITLRNTTKVLSVAGIALGLALFGLLVGFCCVIYPPAVPVAMVGTLGGLLLWLMPDLRYLPDKLGRFMLFPFVFVTLSVPAYYTIIIPGVPWISVRRLFLICLIVPTLTVLAASSEYRHRLGLVFREQRKLKICILIFLIAMVVSSVSSPVLSVALGGSTLIAMTAALPLLAVLLFFRKLSDIRTFMALLVVCNIVDFGLGLIEFLRQKPFLLSLLPAYTQAQILASADNYLNLVTGQGIRNGLFRAASTFNVSLSWGEMAAMIGPIAAYFVTYGRNLSQRVFGLVGIAASFGAIVCSGARGAYLGFFAAMLVYALMWAIRVARSDRKSLAGLLTVVTMGMGAGAFAFALFVGGVGKRYVFGGGAQQNSTQARWEQWALAEPKVLMHPWGYGAATSAGIVNYAPFGSVTLDSYFISVLVDYGIIGFFAWLAIYVVAISSNLKIYLVSTSANSEASNALACSLIAYTIYRLTLSQQENLTSMSLILGVAIFAIGLTKNARLGEPARRVQGAL